MAIKMDSMQKCSTVNEIEIPEGKVENICKQWLVHEDTGLAYKLQEEEIEEHLNHNKIRNQIVRSDLRQAKHIQQTEQQMYQQLRKQKQAQLDEQLAKELQLNLIEEEQKQIMEQQRIADEDEKFAKCLHEKEKQKLKKRKLAREQAQIEKIKRDRLQYYLDNNLDITSTMNDDLDELDLSDFCMKPPDQLTSDQLQMFMAEQDEELARFLQIYENQKKNNLIRDKQELQENQDYEIARLIYEEEKAKLKRLKEKRLQKQRMKQAQQSINQDQPEHYLPDNRLYRLPNQLNDSNLVQDDQYSNEKLYDEPPQEDLSTTNYVNQQVICNDSYFINNTNERDYNCEETNLKQLDDRPTSSNSSNHSHSRNQRLNQTERFDYLQPLRYNAINYQNEDNAQYTLSTKQLINHNVSNQNVTNFVNRALPAIPASNTTKFHNIFLDIDPTHNKSKNDKSKEANLSNDNETLNSRTSNDSSNQQSNNNNLQTNTPLPGIHYASLVRVDDNLQNSQNSQNEFNQTESNGITSIESIDYNQSIYSKNSQNYALNNQQQYMPVQGQKRLPTSSNQKKSKKDKSKDRCRQQ